jgi:hypothetical protein
VAATPFAFSTGDPDGKTATTSRPDSSGKSKSNRPTNLF